MEQGNILSTLKELNLAVALSHFLKFTGIKYRGWPKETRFMGNRFPEWVEIKNHRNQFSKCLQNISNVLGKKTGDESSSELNKI